jgi:Phage integrase family
MQLDAQHFVFPSCENGHIDATIPQKSWRSAWRKLTNAIECQMCGQFQQPSETCSNQKCKADIKRAKSPIAGLRFHDLRHHAITELAESQASDQTIMAIAGHVSPRMLAHYSHVSWRRKGTHWMRFPDGASVQPIQCGQSLVTTQTTTQTGVSQREYLRN